MRLHLYRFARLFASVTCLALLVPARAGFAQNCDVEGSWEVFSLTFTDPDGTIRDVAIGDPPGLKILSDTHWAFVELVPGDPPEVHGGGGRYVVDGGTYVETVTYHSAPTFIGESIAFECRVEGDYWYQSGMLPDGVLLKEVYQRAK